MVKSIQILVEPYFKQLVLKVRLLVYRPHSHKKIAQSFYKVCILTGNTAQTSSISSKIAHFIKTLGNFLCE